MPSAPSLLFSPVAAQRLTLISRPFYSARAGAHSSQPSPSGVCIRSCAISMKSHSLNSPVKPANMGVAGPLMTPLAGACHNVVAVQEHRLFRSKIPAIWHSHCLRYSLRSAVTVWTDSKQAPQLMHSADPGQVSAVTVLPWVAHDTVNSSWVVNLINDWLHQDDVFRPEFLQSIVFVADEDPLLTAAEASPTNLQ